MQCVPRILAAENARLGRPLGDHDLDDVGQDTQLILLRKLREYHGLGVLEAWAFHICRFELMNAVRRRRRQPPSVDDTLEVASAEAARAWQRLLEREALAAAFARIGGVDARLLELRHFEGLTIAEMATRTGLTEPAAKARYFRAMERLEQILTSQRRKEEDNP
jgi:RNA polymerase sigma factor (sigma-70 family)